MKISHFKIQLKLWKLNGNVYLCHSSRTRRIYTKIKADNFIKAYVKVVYGIYKNNFGTTSLFYNDGVYETKTDLLQAFKAFTEIDKANTDNSPVRNGLSE